MDDTDQRHGTRAGYIAGCRDDCCRDPHVKYQKRSTLRRHREGSQIVDATPVLNRITWWEDYGVTRNALSDGAGLGSGTLAELHLGERHVIYKANARKVLAVGWDDLPDNALCNAALAVTRIRSLMAAGHPLAWICERTEGLSVGGRWRYQEAVTLRLARSIQAVYATAPLEGPSKITMVKARNSGALHPLAWDDLPTPAAPKAWRVPKKRDIVGRPHTDIDPAVVVALLDGRNLPSTRAEKVEAMRLWLAAGKSERSLCEALGWHAGRYAKAAEAGAA